MFRMLVNVALDVLSRSLRPMSIYRFILSSIILQFGILHLSINKLLCFTEIQVSSGEGQEQQQQQQPMQQRWIGIFILLTFYWIVYTVIKLETLICSGGITSWFAQQCLLIEQMERMKWKEQQQQQQQHIQEEGQKHTQEEKSFMPEAYANVNANVYISVMEFDEGMDDDDEENDALRHSHIITTGGGIGGGKSLSHRHDGGDWQHITVKSFLVHSFTISFGSLLQCALLGPIANVIANVTYNLDRIMCVFFAPRNYSRQGFQGMTISINGNDNDDYFTRLTIRDKIFFGWKRVEKKAIVFVMNHNDLGLCHVAAYYKSYQRGSHDVMTLLNASGTSTVLKICFFVV